MSRGQFFAVDATYFEEACDLGLNPALAYLVIASGTLKDLRTSAWSADAVRRYSTIRWSRAKAAIDVLQQAKLLTRDKNSSISHPRYVLQKPKHDRLIWLPNRLVTGIDDEDTPVSRLRRGQSVDALRILMRLYAVHDLLEEGGIPTGVLFELYERTRIAERGIHTLWGFHQGHSYAVVEPVFRKLEQDSIWPTIRLLLSVGLLHVVPWVFDGPHDQSGEPLFPLAGNPGKAVHEAIDDYLVGIENIPSLEAAKERHDYIVPLQRAFGDPQLVGVYQLRYLPRAAYTLTGIGQAHRVSERWEEVYRGLAPSRSFSV